MKRFVFAAAALGLIAAPALAQTGKLPDTLQAVIDKGVVIDMQGMPVDVAYKSDGTFSAMMGQFQGTWKVDGNKICITIPGLADMPQCSEYPLGKKAGDSFQVVGDMGPYTVTINK